MCVELSLRPIGCTPALSATQSAAAAAVCSLWRYVSDGLKPFITRVMQVSAVYASNCRVSAVSQEDRPAPWRSPTTSRQLRGSSSCWHRVWSSVEATSRDTWLRRRTVEGNYHPVSVSISIPEWVCKSSTYSHVPICYLTFITIINGIYHHLSPAITIYFFIYYRHLTHSTKGTKIKH